MRNVYFMLVFRGALNGINDDNFNRPFGRIQFQTNFLYRGEEGWSAIDHYTRRNHRVRRSQRHAIKIHKTFLAEP